MARKGENIRKRKDGRWEARYQVTDEQGNKKYRSVYGKTKSEVRQKLRERKQQSSAVKFSEQAEAWLQEKRKTVKASSYATYSTIIETYLNPFFEGMAVEEIDEKEVDRFKMSINDGLSSKTQENIIVCLSMILRFQRKKATILDDTLTKSNDSGVKKILTKEEVVRFIRYLRDDTDLIKLGILVLMCTGIQIGELCALRWKDIDIHEGYVTISRTMQRVSGKSVGEVSKTRLVISEVTERKIPLLDVLKVELMKQQKHTGFLLTGTGKGYEPRRMENNLKLLAKEAGLMMTLHLAS